MGCPSSAAFWKNRGGEAFGREALAEEGGAEGASLCRVLLHQRLKLGGQLGHSQAEVAGELRRR